LAESVYFSFHYKRDNWRVQKVQKIGALQGQPLLNAQEWEEVKRKGTPSIQGWIDRQMAYKRAVVVLVGSETANRPWVQYEIEKAWRDKRPLVGIRIHGLSDVNGHRDQAGPNPFARLSLRIGVVSRTLADYVPLYNPDGATSQQIYGNIAINLEAWVKSAARR
jgi:hypothetical protein